METETFRGKKAREGKMIDSVTQAKCRILSSIRSIHHLFGPATAKFSTASGVQWSPGGRQGQMLNQGRFGQETFGYNS